MGVKPVVTYKSMVPYTKAILVLNSILKGLKIFRLHEVSGATIPEKKTWLLPGTKYGVFLIYTKI